MFNDSKERKHLDYINGIVDRLIWRAMNFMEEKYGQNGEQKFRKCSGCREWFFSTGRHHRFCNVCRMFLFESISEKKITSGQVKQEPALV